MPDIKEQEKIPRKLLPIIYVLDTSGSMSGDRIAAVNSAMTETVEVLRDVSNNNPTAELKIGVLQFASGAKWVTERGFVFMEDFYWNDLNAGGLTDFGSALKELHNKMSRTEFLNSDVGYKVPVIIFMSDGEPTDDYESALQKINENNKWFKVSTKIAIAIGDGANVEVLQKITGSPESVIAVDDLDTLKKLIRVVSVTASMIGTKSRTNFDNTKDTVKEVKVEMGNDIQITDGITSTQTSDDKNSFDLDSLALDSDSDDPWGHLWD